MKKVLVILLFSLLFLLNPNIMKAEIKSETLTEALEKEKIEKLYDKYKEYPSETTLYVFRSQGESKSVALMNFLNSIYEDYGPFMNIVIYEVSDNLDNRELMYNVIDYLKAEVSGAPFMVMGDTYITTYDETVDDNLIDTIKANHNVPEEYKSDKVQDVLVRYYRNDGLILTIVVGVIIGFTALMIYASVKGKKENDKEENEEEVKD